METEDDLAIARERIAAGYRQVSRKHRTVAKLPAGETGLEALARRAPLAYAHLMQQMEQRAADTYRRIYAESEGNWLELDSFDFEAFRKAGGGASW